MNSIPGYEIQRDLGHGGMATVYLAMQNSLGRLVALKVLAPHLARDPVAKERFLREARFAAKLHHPHIVEIYDVGEHEGMPFMAMAYEPGGTAAAVEGATMSPSTALRVARDIAAALDYAHQQGVVHRDVKPENILRRKDGACVLTDFGIALAASQKSALTNEGTSIGTPHYMSPEQLRGEKVDGRADLYSLGVVLFQLLTGKLPYQGTDGWAIGLQHINAPIPRLPPELAHLQALLDALLAKEPGARPQTGAELVRRIETLLTGPISTPTAALPSAPSATPNRDRNRWLVVAGFLIVAVAGGLFMKSRPTPAPAAAQSAPVAAQAIAPSAIAVMSFLDMSQDKSEEYFADGLAEELLNRLAEIPQLRVAGRTSSFSFKGKDDDLRSIGQKLDVASVLEGSVRTSGDRVRVTVQLINVADGYHLWSETYDRQLTDVLAMQDDIAGSIVAALKVKLLPAQSAPRQRRAVNPVAYTQYLKARHDKNLSTPENAEATVKAFQKVIELDPGFADAYAMLAISEFWASDYAENATELAARQQRALAAAETAIKLDPDLPEAFWARGNIRAAQSRDWTGAQHDYQHALELNAGNAQFMQAYASLQATLGQLPEAIALTRKAAEREPLMPTPWQALGYYLDASGEYSEARQAQEHALAIKPKFPFAHFRLGVVSLLESHPQQAGAEFEASGYEPLQLEGRAMTEHSLGNAEASNAALAKLTADYGFNAAYQIAQAHAWRGDGDAAMHWLETALEQNDGGLVEIKYDPLLRSLRADPRYQALLKKLNLPR